nr:DNA cytosine methyltransferase [Nocardia brasiliensis]
MKVGSLFSGAGMLDVAALELFPGSSMAWHCEVDPAAAKVLAQHWPGVPNLGDVTTIDWSTIEPVDVLTGGFPCQDVSLAGRRAGLSEGTRSGLWSHMFRAVSVLRPKLVLIENVRGLLSARAVRNMESGEGDLGAGGGGPLRALGAVLGDLSSIGFDADWALVRASDVGACHQRARVFILAYPAGTRTVGVGTTPAVGSVPGGVTTLLPTPQVADVTGGHRTRSGARSNELLLPGVAEAYTAGSLLPTPRASDGGGGPNPLSWPEQKDDVETRLLRISAKLLPTPDTGVTPNGHGRRGGKSGNGRQSGASLDAVAKMLPTPSAADGTGGGQHPDKRAGHSRQLIDYALLDGSARWGEYEPAIRRQQSLSRPTPAPTEPNRNGNPRLSAAFAEWMMFWPSGWVTDPVIGLSRNEQLKIIGNGVVPRQAVAAFRYLLDMTTEYCQLPAA